jgi:hypothetical protein
MNTNTDYSKPMLEMIKDLHDLDFQVASNTKHESYEELADFILTYDVGFPLASLVSLGYVELDSLPAKAIEELELTWNCANDLDYFDIEFN